MPETMEMGRLLSSSASVTRPEATGETSLAGDLMIGAKPISDFLGISERQVYYAREKKLLPLFDFGGRPAALKSTLRQHVLDRARAAVETVAAK
jgi:hypothetical protein